MIENLKQVLLLGFSNEDAQKIQEKISDFIQQCKFTVTNTIDEFLSIIKKLAPDIIISNHQSSYFDGLSALKIARDTLPSTPFIFLTKLDDVQTAVECMREGASNFILWKEIEKMPNFVSKLLGQKDEQAILQDKQKILLKRLEKFEQLAELCPLPISIIDKEGRYVYINPKFTEIFGYSLDDIPTGREWFIKAYPEDAKRLMAIETWKDDLAKADIYQFRPRDFKVTCKDGSLKDILFMPVSIKDGEQIVIYDDITEKKRFEDALQKSEQELQRQNVLIASLIMKSDWFKEDLNTNIKRILEVASELIPTERVSVWRYSEDLSKIQCIGLYEKSLKKHSYGEELISADFPDYTASHSNGKVIAAYDVFTDRRTSQIPSSYFIKHGITSLLDAPVYVGGRLAGLLSFEHVGEKRKWSSFEEALSLNIATHVSLCFEIDDRKRLEKALKDSEEKYRTIFEGSSEGFFIMTDKFIDCNQQACNILRCSKDNIIGSSPLDFSPQFQPDGRTSEEAAKKYIELAIGGLPQRFYWQHKRKDGVLIDTEISLVSLNVGEEILLFATMVDITEKKQIEDALKKTEEKYRNIFENSIEGIFQITPEGRFISANPALAEMFGYDSSEEFIKGITNLGKQLYYDPQDYLSSLRILKDKGYVKNYLIRACRKDRTTFWLSLNAKGVYDKKGNVRFYEGTVQDITEQKRLEEQLRQAQKMEAVGTLAGGVAHDFNNILTIIMGYAHLTLMKLKDDETLRSYINQIISAVEKATNLTNSLLAFSRKQIVRFAPLEINDLIKNLEKMLLRIIGEDIELKTFLSDEDLVIMADSNQIEQVLMNLASNARDAMPKGGLIIIETERVEIDEEYIKLHNYGNVGSYALITFTDFGTGMDKKTLEKIFEPFFTTKEAGKGSGLGLSMVYGIVKQHNGYINCYSELSKGTTFKIYLPLCQHQQRTVAKNKAIPLHSVFGTETILVAEDDENVRKLTRYIFEKYGYRVIEAIDGMDAIDKFKQNQDVIDLLIFDVIMPSMNGKAAYEEIKKIQPNIQAIFMSGYAPNAIHKKGILEEGLNIIFKPASPMTLLNKVREVLSMKDKNG